MVDPNEDVSSDRIEIPDEASLSHLSSQLIAHGYLARPLDLISLFSTPAPLLSSLSSSSQSHSLPTDSEVRKALKKTTERRIAEDRARDQISRCLWKMLSARIETTRGMEELSTQVRVLTYDNERVKAMLKSEQIQRMNAEREQEAEKARAKAANNALIAEQERHRHAKDELTKARSALQFVKTQVLHEQKRRETELSATLLRLQRLTSDPAQSQSKITILNPALRHSSRSATIDSSSIAMLEEALCECNLSRANTEQENGQLRVLIGDIDEWAELMKSVRGIETGESNMEYDEALTVPQPHMSQPPSYLSPLIHSRLYHIRTSIVDIVESTDTRVTNAVADIEAQLDIERIGRASEKLRRIQVEGELKGVRDLVLDSQDLVRNFTSKTFLQGMTEVELDGDQDDTGSAPSPGVVKPTTKGIKQVYSLAAFEAQRAAGVSDFLSELGESPAPAPVSRPTKQKRIPSFPPSSVPLVKPSPRSRPPKTAHLPIATGGPMLPPSLTHQPKPKSTSNPVAASKSRPPASTRRPVLETLVEASFDTSASPPSAVNTDNQDALASILAMALSPPPKQLGSRGGSDSMKKSTKPSSTSTR